jgi:hypothetical protein
MDSQAGVQAWIHVGGTNRQASLIRKRLLGANLGATRVNDFPRPANECEQATSKLPRSRTDLDDAERDTGNYGSEGWGSNPSERATEATGQGLATGDGRDHESRSRA